MASQLMASSNVLFDETRWLNRVRQSLEREVAEELGVIAKVFDVPKILRATKPEAYVPHYFAFGPYHQHRAELHDMERYKLAAAKRAEKCFKDLKFDHLVQRFVDMDDKIRAPYHRYLELHEQTLAWMMAIDTCFVLDFLQNYHHEEGRIVSSATNWINAVVRDVMMLENQIPLFLLSKTLELKYASEEAANDMLRTIFDRFIMEVSPIKTKVSLPDINKHVHLLELLYHFLVPSTEGESDQHEVIVSDEVTMEMLDQLPDYDKVKQACFEVSRLDAVAAPIRFVKTNLISKPLNTVSKLPGKLASKIPLLTFFNPFIEKFVSPTDIESRLKDVNLRSIITSPLAQEIMVPSVAQLAASGVRFIPTPDGINGIDFDLNTATFSLPIITVDANTEVILRNLVAYEALAVKGSLVLARYTELMNGIIDTAKDVKILRQSGIIVNHMKSDKEVADVWNGMCRSIRLTRVPNLDRVIREVNIHRNKKLIVRTNKFLKKYVFKSWRLLTLLAALILLLMTGLQTFCSVYTCNRWFAALVPPENGAH